MCSSGNTLILPIVENSLTIFVRLSRMVKRVNTKRRTTRKSQRGGGGENAANANSDSLPNIGNKYVELMKQEAEANVEEILPKIATKAKFDEMKEAFITCFKKLGEDLSGESDEQILYRAIYQMKSLPSRGGSYMERPIDDFIQRLRDLPYE
jgi:hypothetical protein